jgi:sugar (pentulose or hexulose) kinase
MAEASCAVPGAGKLLFLPFLIPERFPIWDPNMRGAFLGLTFEHGRQEMMRAVVESAGFAVRTAVSAMMENGCQISDIRVTGGLARLPLWCQSRADIIGVRVLVPEQEDPDLVGNACVGFYGVDEFETPGEAAENLVRIQKTFTPSAGARHIYDELFDVFTRACNEMGDALRGPGYGEKGSPANED